MSLLDNVHELAITENIVKVALEEAKAAGAKKITGINVVVGELSGVVSDCVRFYFDFLKTEGFADSVSLNFEQRAAVLRCRDCSTEFRPEGNGWSCPGCRSLRVEVIKGRDCYLSSIEVEE